MEINKMEKDKMSLVFRRIKLKNKLERRYKLIYGRDYNEKLLYKKLMEYD